MCISEIGALLMVLSSIAIGYMAGYYTITVRAKKKLACINEVLCKANQHLMQSEENLESSERHIVEAQRYRERKSGEVDVGVDDTVTEGGENLAGHNSSSTYEPQPGA